MDPHIRQAISAAVKQEPFCRHLGMELVELETGYSVIEADYRPEQMDNLFRRAHGGALFALIDEAFETVAQSDGTIAVALNINVTYIASPDPGSRLRAEARQISATRKTANYEIRISAAGRLLATCQALAYRTGKPLPFL
jgi:acyl-CoA thioesterase